LAKALKISLSKIYEMRADGDLPFYEIGSQYRFRLSEVLEAFSGKVEVKRAGRSNRKDKLWLV
jgi:excisionase family DNA binding protein